MTSEMREKIVICMDYITSKELKTITVREEEISGIRILPANRYLDAGARTMTPEELNQAVQMWMNKKHTLNESEPKEDPRHDSVYQRLEALEAFRKQMEATFCNCPVKDFINFDERIRACEERTRAYPERNRWQLKLEELEKKVKALEDQHREIPPDPEKYICIDLEAKLGPPFKKFYVEKPEK